MCVAPGHRLVLWSIAWVAVAWVASYLLYNTRVGWLGLLSYSLYHRHMTGLGLSCRHTIPAIPYQGHTIPALCQGHTLSA